MKFIDTKEQTEMAATQTTDPKQLGNLIATQLRWDGDAIMETFIAALTEANFHSEAAQVQAMIDELA